MKRTAIYIYRPRKGKENELLDLLRQNIHTLRKENLITRTQPMLMRAEDGAIIEVLEWISQEAVDGAPANLAVQKMWEEVSKICDFEKPVKVREFSEMFSEFETLETEL